MIGFIYKITNPKGRVYIGQTIDMKNRFKSYKYGTCKGQPKLYRSIKKYGFDKHLVEILETTHKSLLNELEVMHIRAYDSVKKGLNCTEEPIAFMRGRKHSKATRLKMTGKRQPLGIRTEAHKKALSESIKKGYLEGRTSSRKGISPSLNTREKQRLTMTGRKASLETRLKISESGKDRTVSEETRLKKSNTACDKLDKEALFNIIQELEKGTILRLVAQKFNISISKASDIKNGKRLYLTNNKNLQSAR